VVAESKASVSDVRADAKEKCDRLMRNRVAEERKGGGGRPSARGQGTVESYVNAGQQKESRDGRLSDRRFTVDLQSATQEIPRREQE
jgi:hypothetical protein